MMYGCSGILALEVHSGIGSAMDGKVFEARLDVDVFSVCPWKWNVEEIVYREYGYAKKFTTPSKLLLAD